MPIARGKLQFHMGDSIEFKCVIGPGTAVLATLKRLAGINMGNLSASDLNSLLKWSIYREAEHSKNASPNGLDRVNYSQQRFIGSGPK